MPRMDELDNAIEDLRRKIAKWTRQAEEGKVALAAMERAAKLRPGPNGVRRPADADYDSDAAFIFPPAPDAGRRPGRRPGAISAAWRNVLFLLYMTGAKPFSYAQIHEHAVKVGLEVDIASVRDRVRNFVIRGLMIGTAEAGFEVTEAGAEQLALGERESAPPEDTPDGADKAEGA